MTKNITSFKLSTRFLLSLGFIFAVLLIMSPLSFVRAESLTRQLQLGMSGTDVSTLQTFLAQDKTIYPQGLVTGYFGSLTKSAVSNFQSRNGISTVGRVGPVTLVAINLQMAGGITTSGGEAPMIGSVGVSVNNTTATVNWNTNVFAKGVVYYSSSPLVTYERTNSVDVSGNTAMTDAGFKTSQSVSIHGLLSNTPYYYLIYSTDQAGNVSVSWPSSFKTTN